MKSLTYLILIMLLLPGCKDEAPLTNVDDALKTEILTLVNEHRVHLGLRPLKNHTVCEREAQDHSADMAAGAVEFGHYGSDARFDRITAETGAIGLAENVAFGQKTAEQVVESWLDSQSHRENIEGDYSHIGIGVAEDSRNQLFFTQIFAKID